MLKLMTDALIKQYQLTGSKELENQIMENHKGYIQANINKWGGVLPQATLNAYGNHYAKEAFKSYDPSKGASINTHLYNNISQLSRLVYQHQNVSGIPEHLIQMIGKVKQAQNHLSDEFGRDPTTHEVADYMHLPLAHIAKVIKFQRADLVNDSDFDMPQNAVSQHGVSDRIFSYRNSLDPKQQQQFDDITGFNNTKPLSPQDFGKKYNLKPYEVSRLKTTFAKGLS